MDSSGCRNHADKINFDSGYLTVHDSMVIDCAGYPHWIYSWCVASLLVTALQQHIHHSYVCTLNLRPQQGMSWFSTSHLLPTQSSHSWTSQNTLTIQPVVVETFEKKTHCHSFIIVQTFQAWEH